MQRRAAAISAAVLLLIAVGAYAVIGLAEEPTIEVEAAHTLGAGDQFSAGGEQFTVSSIDAEGGTATIAWVNESGRRTTTLDNDTTVSPTAFPWANASRDFPYRVLVRDAEAGTFVLREDLNVTAILQNDPDVENTTLTDPDGTRYVRYDNGTTRPLDSYLPEPTTRTFAVGDELVYKGNTTTVRSVTESAVTLSRPASVRNTVEASDGANVTLPGGTTYLAHFDQGRLKLVADYHDYAEDVEQITYFHERVAGLWGVSLLSGITAVLLVGLTYLPSRY
ncbi:MAG: hypothetical protein ABEJ08_06030 [Halobacteriaceae archaeon]